MKKAAIYARVSSQKQKDEETIDSQIHILREFGNKEGYITPENWVFLDNGVSGLKLQRPALDELRDTIECESVDAVLIYAPDRLARSYPHQLILLEEFRKQCVKVYFIKNAPQGSDTPESVMFNHFQGIFAEYERALILDRSRRGRIHKAKQGDQSILPSVPFGYCKIKKERQTVIEIVVEKANIVRQIFKDYIYEQVSLNEISRRLLEKGIKSPRGSVYWSRSTIAGILKNRTYTGSAHYGKTARYEGIPDKIKHYKSGKSIKPKSAKKALPEAQWFEISVPPLINENDFELAQERINKNKESSLRNTREESLLQGLVICGECGCPFYKKLRKNNSSYCCRSYFNSRIKTCSTGQINQQKLDDLVYNEIISMLQNPTVIRQELQRREKESLNLEETGRQEISVKKELENLTKERERLLDAYQSGLINLESLSQRNQNLDKKRNELDRDIRALQAEKLAKEMGTNWEETFEAAIKRIKKSSAELSFKEKQKLIRLIVDRIVIDKEEIKIMHCISPKIFKENGPLCCDSQDYHT